MTFDTLFFATLVIASLAAHAWLPRDASGARRLIRELLLILPMVLLYFLVRGLVDARPAQAFANAERVIDVEQKLGIFHEPALQRASIDTPLLRDALNLVYVWGHWPVIAGVMAWLVLRRPDAWARYRNAFLLSGTLAMFAFALFPVAPPRLTDGYGFVDTITLHSHSYRVLQPPSLANPYAAMPSLHLGWDLLMGIILFREASHRLARLTGILLPLAMFAAIVLTANHYLLDGLAGAALVLASLLAVTATPRLIGEIRPIVRSRAVARWTPATAAMRGSRVPAARMAPARSQPSRR